jgi:hypothetical protein
VKSKNIQYPGSGNTGNGLHRNGLVLIKHFMQL